MTTKHQVRGLPLIYFTCAALTALVAVLMFVSACGSSVPQPSSADRAYLATVRADHSLARFSDLDLMSLGHQLCATLNAHDGDATSFNDDVDSQGIGLDDRAFIFDGAITHYCPRYSSILEGGGQ